MRKESKAFLEGMVAVPSPSGYEGPAREVYKAEMQKYADKVETDLHGNAIAVLNAKGNPRIMLAGHMDELGFQVAHITDSGYIHFHTIGGFDPGIIPGRKVRIHTKKGEVLGITGKRAIHLMSGSDLDKVAKIHELWIDIGAKDGKEARKLIDIGDPITYDPNFEMLRGDLAVARGFDDRMGSFVAAETLRLVKQSRKKAKAGLYAVATVQEEIGLRGARTSAYGVDPTVGIAIDVTHSSDYPDVDKRKVGDLQLGKGPVIARGANVSPVVFDMLVKVAEKNDIPYQIEAEAGGTGTDANAIQLSRAGVATGLVSVALRYMHTPVEILSLKDLENTSKLLAAFVLSVDEKTSFIP
ncbi:MAG: M42 family metallopeptidase [Gemmatimonadetes bacterium]|nr:M42 family metallopeptidase [Gemmatimonadota bacterium]